jgi:predicted MFS family arabinose efflux permease
MRPRNYAPAALAILTALNFFNYIDRSVLFSVQQLIADEFHVSDVKIGVLTASFFYGYMAAAFIAGYLADRYQRRTIIVIGALLWSAATLMTALTYDYRTLLIRHIIVGVGEATFVAIAPSFISDMYREEKRGRVMAIFNMAIPVGSALGFIIGAYFGAKYGWRRPFYIGAAPGFFLAVAMMFVPEPQRGSADTIASTRERGTLRGLLRNRAYWTATLGMAFMTYALGGLQVWMPTFLARVRHLSLQSAGEIFGGMVLFDGITAALFGGWLSDRMLRRRPSANYLVSAASLAIGIPAMLVALYTAGPLMFPGILVAAFLLLVNTGPLNAAVVNSVDARIRATAVAVNLFVIHLLGDASSPVLIPLVSKRMGSFEVGFLSAVVAIAVASVILFYGMRFAPPVKVAEPPRGATA